MGGGWEGGEGAGCTHPGAHLQAVPVLLLWSGPTAPSSLHFYPRMGLLLPTLHPSPPPLPWQHPSTPTWLYVPSARPPPGPSHTLQQQRRLTRSLPTLWWLRLQVTRASARCVGRWVTWTAG